MKSLTDIFLSPVLTDKKGKTGIQGSVFRFRDQDTELLVPLCTFVIKLASYSVENPDKLGQQNDQMLSCCVSLLP